MRGGSLDPTTVLARYVELPGLVGALRWKTVGRLGLVVEDMAVEHARPLTGDDASIVRESLLALPADSASDALRRALRDAVIVHDPSRVLFARVAAAVTLSDEVRSVRMRTHYFEVTRLGKRIQTSQQRGREDVVRVLAAELVLATAKVLFLAERQWPPALSELFDELASTNAPPSMTEALERLIDAPAGRAVRIARAQLDRYLLGLGETFVSDPVSLWAWLFETPEGREAQDVWGSECIRRG